MNVAGAFQVRAYTPADGPALQELAAAIAASGVAPRQYSMRSEPAGLLFLVAERGDKLLGSVMAVQSPGATALLLSPLSTHPDLPDRETVEDALLAAALAELAEAGVKLVHVLLPFESGEVETQPLERADFRRITQLRYARHPLTELPPAEPLTGLTLLPFKGNSRRFADATLEAFQGSLDCPEMDGLRTIDETLTGYAFAGDSGISRWRLIEREGQAVGVLIVMAIAEESALDLVYLGFRPDARRQGLGRKLLRHLLHEAKAEGWQAVSLSYDARNEPAEQLYLSHGFGRTEEKQLYLRALPVE